MLSNKQIPLSENQIPGLKRAIQLFKKSVALSNSTRLKEITDMKLSHLQDEVARALHFGSYSELNSISKKNQIPAHIDCQNITSDNWTHIRESIYHYFSNIYGDSISDKERIYSINWYCLPDSQLTDIVRLCSQIVESSNGMLTEVNSKSLSPEIKHQHSFKDSRFLSFSDYDVRNMTRIVKVAAKELNLESMAISNTIFVVGTSVISLVINSSSLIFQVTQLGHHNSKSMLPFVCITDTGYENGIILREVQGGYYESYLDAERVNNFIQVSKNQVKGLATNSILPGSRIDLLVTA